MTAIVFDTNALLAWLKNEPDVAFVRGLLEKVLSGSRPGGVCSVNVGEVYYLLARERGSAAAEEWLGLVESLEWTVYPARNELVYAAARFKARFRMSYADAFALACAHEQQAELVTGDPELLAADHGVPILWPGHEPENQEPSVAQ